MSHEAAGLVKSFAARRHIAIPGGEAIPASIATAVLQLRVADVEALGALFATPGDRTEMEADAITERSDAIRPALTGIDARIAAMDAAGQAMAVLSI